jgi:hypothetical protein
VLYRVLIKISEFSYIIRRSLVLRSDGVIAYLVRVGIIRGIIARVRPVIWVYSVYYRAKDLS